jgi:hypothetical protein
LSPNASLKLYIYLNLSYILYILCIASFNWNLYAFWTGKWLILSKIFFSSIFPHRSAFPNPANEKQTIELGVLYMGKYLLGKFNTKKFLRVKNVENLIFYKIISDPLFAGSHYMKFFFVSSFSSCHRFYKRKKGEPEKH